MRWSRESKSDEICWLTLIGSVDAFAKLFCSFITDFIVLEIVRVVSVYVKSVMNVEVHEIDEKEEEDLLTYLIGSVDAFTELFCSFITDTDWVSSSSVVSVYVKSVMNVEVDEIEEKDGRFVDLLWLVL